MLRFIYKRHLPFFVCLTFPFGAFILVCYHYETSYTLYIINSNALHNHFM